MSACTLNSFKCKIGQFGEKRRNILSRKLPVFVIYVSNVVPSISPTYPVYDQC